MPNPRFPLGNLPLEILRHIVALLERKELKTLRSTSRYFCSVASENMFEEIALSTTDSSFVQLLNIVKSEFWSSQVRHIDWVLLNSSGEFLALRQRIQFESTHPFDILSYDLRNETWPYPTYDGLGLQCQLVQHLSNVQTVRFWCANIYQRQKMEAWELHRSCNNAILGSILECDPSDSPHMPHANDVFALLLNSNLKPTVVKTVNATVRLVQSTKAKILEVHISSVRDDPHRQRDIGRYSQNEEAKFFNHDLNCFGSLAESGTSTLRKLSVSGIWIFVQQIATIVDTNSQLGHLQIGDVELDSGEEDDDPKIMVFLLAHLRALYQTGGYQELRVEFQNTGHRDLLGVFNANGQQVHDWMSGYDDDLLAAAKDAYYEANPEDEDENEESDENEGDDNEGVD